MESIFVALDEERLSGSTSTITLLETLVIPVRAGNFSLAERYEFLLTHSRGLRLLDLNRPLVRLAAQIRGLEGLKTPDAIQVAAALHAGCTTFVTNDRRIPAIGGLRVLQLRDYCDQLESRGTTDPSPYSDFGYHVGTSSQPGKGPTSSFQPVGEWRDPRQPRRLVRAESLARRSSSGHL